MNSTPFIPQSSALRATTFQKPAYRTQMCNEYLQGFCSYGETCRFAHSADQLRPAPRAPNYKTVPCRSYSKTGFCKYGRKCQFLHNELHNVMSPVTYSTTAMTSSSPSTTRYYEYTASSAPTYKPGRCNSYSARGFCRYGNKCRYSHENTDSIWASVKSSDPTTTSPLSSTIGSPSDSMFDGYSSSTDSGVCSINLDFLDEEPQCSSPEPTDEPWPLSSKDRTHLTQIRSSDMSPPSVDERYPSSLIALRPIYDEWQRIQKEPWGKPQKRSDGGFDPFFY